MQITNVSVYPTFQGPLRAYADVTFDNSLCVREFRLLRMSSGYVVCTPSDGEFRDVAYARDDKSLQIIQKAIIAEYEKITGVTIRSKRRTWHPT
jgi:DNA-binding cell septation regulator SpoVG